MEEEMCMDITVSEPTAKDAIEIATALARSVQQQQQQLLALAKITQDLQIRLAKLESPEPKLWTPGHG